MTCYLVKFAVFGALVALSASSLAQCDALVRGGVFDYKTLASDDQKIASFQSWARDRRSSKTGDSSSGSIGVDIIDILKLDAGGQSTKSSEFWQDVEGYNSSNIAQRSRLLTYAKTVNEALVAGLNECLRIKGLHVWLETTARSDTFRVAANFNSPGEPKVAHITDITFVPGSPAVRCNNSISANSQIGGSTKRLTCVRTSCQGVVVTLNATVDAIGGGNLDLPSAANCGGTPVPGKTLAQRINEGKTFTVTFDSLVTNVGTILPGRALVGTYSQGEKAWRVWGPNGPTGRFLPQGSNDGLYGCGPGVPAGNKESTCSGPLDYKLNIWGAIFTFDEQAIVRMYGVLAGHVAVAD